MDISVNGMEIMRERIMHSGDSTPEDVYKRVAKAIAAEDELLESQYYEMITRKLFLPNSPCLMNAGTEIGQLCACFVLPIEDDMGSIFGAIKNMAMVQKSGGGTGFSFSKLRPKGDKVKTTGGVASGPISFLKIFNAATEEIKQGGKRRGASIAVMRVDHPDIMDFITCKKDTSQITNFNISVGITNKFIAAVKQDNDFELINPRNNEVTRVIPARQIWDAIVQNAWETGEPGVLFLDTINADNPTPKLGVIEATNPCGETNLLPFEACVLGSLNLAKMVKFKDGKYQINEDLIVSTAILAVCFLDSVIDVSTYPLPEIEQMTKANRKIGLGIMGLADMFFQLGIPYDSQEALDTAGHIMKLINQTARETSEMLARQKGAFPNFYDSVWADGPPRRNAVVTSIAPTGTLAAIAGCTFSAEPEYALVYTKTILNGKQFDIVNPYFEQALRQHGIYSEYLIEKIKANKGSVQGMKEIPESIQRIFKVAHDIPWQQHVKMQAALQEHTEQSISKTINLPESATPQDVADAYMLAWELECKGVTLYRDGARPNQVLSVKYKPTERPEVLDGKTHKYKTGCGSLYITINPDLAGDPYEAFITHAKDDLCVNALLNALAKLASNSLRSGVDPDVVAESLIGQSCGRCEGIKSCADAVGQALKVNKSDNFVKAHLTDKLSEQIQEQEQSEKIELPMCDFIPGGGCPTCG